MKYLVILFFSLILCSASAYAQDYTKHKVEKGETVAGIAKKYKITPYDIYRLNPDAKNGLKTDSILLIPGNPVKPLPATAAVKEEPTKVANIVHQVEAKETLYSIAKKYNVTVADLEKANTEALANGLKDGQELIIPIKGSGVAAQAKVAEKQQVKKNEPSYFFHVVEAGETKYSIAKQFGMTLQLLEELNPEVKDNLPLGFKLKLAKDAVVAEAKIPEPAPAPKKDAYIDYTVQPKETFYSIGKATGLTEDEIVKLNPQAKDGLKEGMVLKLPTNAPMPDAVPAGTVPMTGLATTIKKGEQKELALLLPFNLYRVESDTVRAKLLRTDKFINLTLDFYAGALVAIDSAKAMGLPLKVKILDSKETSKSSDLTSLKASLTATDVIVGPFFQSHAEAAAAMFPTIPVISPLAKDSGKPYKNLYQSIPTDESMRTAMLNYLKSKNGNVVGVIDSKKASSKQFIKAGFPEVKFVEGGITTDNIKSKLVKDKTNYVILDTESLTTVTGTTKLLEELANEYNIQLALMDKTDNYDHDEMPLTRLIKLKMLYPTFMRNDVTPQTQLFDKVFRQKHGYAPSSYAIRGFDVTFDAILRLFQPEDITAALATKGSEQVENKFMYAQQNGGNYNTGVYIMQYDTDFNVIQAQ
ncbi:LysM peptidoglycan-binding domain-containing protein [Flavobacterium zepuense]|uniref:LysM peptidoglycan-binding domain-containing protein n=1 Tax=Flavobacterium zepuense TaxID=2593302 RepID=A0A552VAB6_9FLAO|nr:LysM peptidoglycan-binding domain-containing protein [Flavobacterium zepuense]TRW27428.1 LysM peptidoglycan-binding domain-containing protein [Flavobacterium zepuense]